MTIKTLTIGEPFFALRLLEGEQTHAIDGKAIVLNLGDADIKVEKQNLGALQSVILRDTEIRNVTAAIVVAGFDDCGDADEAERMAAIRKAWPTAFAIRGEERLRGVEHYMSPKVQIGRFAFTLYHSASVPLDVGLHREHPFCPVAGFREVHTQIMGFGKMQQCRENDPDTLYLEEVMAPGVTHRPMYDAAGNYPWHQFETITPSVILAVEILPPGFTSPEHERSQ